MCNLLYIYKIQICTNTKSAGRTATWSARWRTTTPQPWSPRPSQVTIKDKYTNTQEYKHVNSEIQSNYPSHGRGQLRWQSIADCCIRPKRQTNTMKPISKYISQLFIWCLHICNSWIQTLLDIVNLCCIIYGPMKICNVMSIYGGKTSQPNLAILKNRAMCMGGKRMEYFPTKIEPLLFLFSSIFLLLLE